jgi:hypothetical protein
VKVPRGALTILALLLAPQMCRAYVFDRIIDLYTYQDGPEHPRVHSYAKAVPYTCQANVVEMGRQVVCYLYRAKDDLGLKFEGAGLPSTC